MFSAAGTSGSFFFGWCFSTCVCTRGYIYTCWSSLSLVPRIHTYYYSVLYFSMSHTILLLLSFLNRTAGNPTASTHLLELLLLMHPVMYTAHVLSSLYFSEQIRAPCGCRAWLETSIVDFFLFLFLPFGFPNDWARMVERKKRYNCCPLWSFIRQCITLLLPAITRSRLPVFFLFHFLNK